MPEILAMLDAVIVEVGQRVRASSRNSRQGDCLLVDAEPDKALKSKALTALPVLPVKNDAIRGGTEGMSEKTLAASNSGDAAREESISKCTGITGSTGSIQDSCGLERSRDFVAHGNYGDFRASLGDTGARLDQTGTTARSLNGVPAEWLDGMARLRVAPVPPGIAEARWTKIVETADDLLERWGGQLAALGWTAADVFGADPVAPWTRLDCMGLVPLLGDRELTAVTTEIAVLKTPSGATQRFYRRHPALGRPLWGFVR